MLLLAFPAALMSAANAVIGTGAVWRITYLALALLGLYPHRRGLATGV